MDSGFIMLLIVFVFIYGIYKIINKIIDKF